MVFNIILFWLFDFDNILYNVLYVIFFVININMNCIIKCVLDNDGQFSDEVVVNYLWWYYWKFYGVILLGLVWYYGLGVDEFLYEVYLFDDFLGMVCVECGIGCWFLQLLGQKILFINVLCCYLCELVWYLGLYWYFLYYIFIEFMYVYCQLCFKFLCIMLCKLLVCYKVVLWCCILVEDMVDNFKSVCELGVCMVWVMQYLCGSQVLFGYMGGQCVFSCLLGFVDVKVCLVWQLL